MICWCTADQLICETLGNHEKLLSDSCHFLLEIMVLITYEQNIICSKTHLDDASAHEKTIICRQLIAGHVAGPRPVKRKKKCIAG